MNKQEFEQFVMRDGKDILRFCRMNAGDTERGNELYQDTMLMLLEKRNQLNAEQNVKSYALYTAILLWKNKKKKYAVRNRILPMSSLEEHVEQGGQFRSGEVEKSPEQQVLNQAEIEEIQSVVAALIIVGNATAGHYMTHTNQTEQGEVTVEENPFVICAQAAELTRDNPVYIKEAVSDTFGFMYGDNEGKAGFIMEIP